MTKTNPGQFIRQVRQEVSKVTWPSRRETMLSGATVLGMSVIVALFFAFVDQILQFVITLVLEIGG